MAVNDRSGGDITPYSQQHILNQSFDQDTQLLIIEQGGFDGQNIQKLVASAVTMKIDYVSGTNPIYLGIAAPGTATSAAFWQIKKMDYDGNNNVMSIAYAGGTPSFNSIWDDRATLSYS
jgi:hypothetical protein